MRQVLLVITMLASATLVPHEACAGSRELADRGSANYRYSGQYWFDPEPGLTLTINGAFLPLNFGSGAPASRSVTMDPRGQIVFGTGDFIAPLLTQTAYTVDPDFLSAIFINVGNLAPFAIDATRPITSDPDLPTYDESQDLNAVRFWWNSVCTPSSPCDGSGNGTVDFQAILVGLGNDSFLLQYNYGFNGTNVPSDATASFALESNSLSFDGPYSQVGPDYCFNHGVLIPLPVFTIDACTGATPSVVPEPDSRALMGTGLFAAFVLGFVARRRRVLERATLPRA